MTSPAPGFIHVFEPGVAGQDRALLLLHGTGGDEHDMLSLGKMVAPDFARLAPRGQVKEGDLNRYFRRFAEGVIDPEDARTRAIGLADFVVAAAAQYGIDRRKLTAIGYSNGANMVTAMMLLRPDTFGDAVLLRPMLPFQPDPGLDLSGRRVLVLGGASDQVVSPAEVASHVNALGRTGATVEGTIVAAGHQLARPDLEAIRAWLTSVRS